MAIRRADPPNTLYYGDNLDILRRYIDDESVDLIYLDPPFNSNADYNVLFAEKDGTQAHAQIKAFEDTWTWDIERVVALPGLIIYQQARVTIWL
jgi:DNA modification methylase